MQTPYYHPHWLLHALINIGNRNRYAPHPSRTPGFNPAKQRHLVSKRDPEPQPPRPERITTKVEYRALHRAWRLRLQAQAAQQDADELQGPPIMGRQERLGWLSRY